MKTIVLMPVKNEGWILDTTLKNISPFVDHIIIADQYSIDDTLNICRKYGNVKIIKNENEGHGNKVRWDLLEEARKIEGNNLIICLDADELISKTTIDRLKSECSRSSPGISFSLPWIQLWKGFEKHRVDGDWKNNYKTIVFYDDKKDSYVKNFVINDHTSRIPEYFLSKNIILENNPLLHFHFVATKRSKIKQAWYKCSELIDGKKTPRYINYKYSVADSNKEPETEIVPDEWIKELNLPDTSKINANDDIRLAEIMSWFNNYGVKFFESLDIWYIKELEDEFIKKVGRKPKIKIFPNFLIQFKKIINKILKH